MKYNYGVKNYVSLIQIYFNFIDVLIKKYVITFFFRTILSSDFKF
jgi:hypothetical protein